MADYPIYLDTQSSSRIAAEVQKAVSDYWSNGNGNPHSPHEHGRRAKEQITLSLRNIADFIGCLPSELTLLSGATAANNLAIKGIEPLREQGRDQILVSARNYLAPRSQHWRGLDRSGSLSAHFG